MMTKIFGAFSAFAMLFTLACGDNCPPCAPSDAPTLGYVAARWAIVGADAQPASCTLVGATSVVLTMHPRAGGDDITLTSACVAASATLRIATGAYDVTPSLVTANGATIATAATVHDVVITVGQESLLAPVTFTVARSVGSLALRITTASQTATNCTTAQGNPIAATILTMRTPDGTCVPATLTRSKDGAVVGHYTINCETPSEVRCIEQDETMSVDGLAAGPYAITVSGVTGSSVCALAEEVFRVGAGVDNSATIQLAPVRGTGC